MNERAMNPDNSENQNNTNTQPNMTQPVQDNQVSDDALKVVVEVYESGQRYLHQAEVFVRFVDFVLKSDHKDIDQATLDALKELAALAKIVIASNPFKDPVESKDPKEIEKAFFNRFKGEAGDYKPLNDYMRKLAFYAAMTPPTAALLKNSKVQERLKAYNNSQANLMYKTINEYTLNDNVAIHFQRMQKYQLFVREIIRETGKND